MSTASDGDVGFLTFYREYAHTGIHTVTATALTAFGLLTFVHRGFVALAIAVYVLPPIYLYLTRDGEAPEPVDDDTGTGEATPERAEGPGSESIEDEAASVEHGEERPDRGGSTAGGTVADTESSDRRSASPAGSTGREASETRSRDGIASGSDAGNGSETASAAGPATAGTGTRSPDDEEPEAGPEAAPGSSGGNDAKDPADESSEVKRSESASGSEPEPGTEAGAPSNPPTPEAGEEGLVGDEDDSAGGDDTEGADENEETERVPAEWIEADSPTEETLFDAVAADGNAYAAGTNGVLLAREEGWELALESGPTAESTTLRGVDATDDGGAIWVAGDSGVLGRYDPEAGRHTDHSAPEGITDNWADLAVAGTAGAERVALVNGSGQVLLGEYDGSEVEWDEPVKPGSGSSMSAIEFVDDSTGYCCDTNSGVYRIDGGDFERIGVEDGGAFTALAATDGIVAVADDTGVVQRFDGSVWTPVRVAEDALSGLDTDGEEWLAAGAGGAIHENRGGDWEAVDSPTETDLFAVASGDLPVAVGEGGTLLERA